FGCTVTCTLTTWPIASRTVTVTKVVVATSDASSGIVLPVTIWVTGSSALLLENARYGATPPTTVSRDWIPEKMSVGLGRTSSSGGATVSSGNTVTATLTVEPRLS